MTFVVLFLASLWAGIQNALAGGGSFITLPLLMLTGMDARAANIASTIALFPAQMATGWTGRKDVSGAAGLSFRALVIISLVGGALGAVLLLVTPSAFFAHLVPWLVLFATAIFAWGSFGPQARGRSPAQACRHRRGTIRHLHLRRLFRRRHRLSDARRVSPPPAWRCATPLRPRISWRAS